MVTRIHYENFDSGVRDVYPFDLSTDRRLFAVEVNSEDATERYAYTADNETLPNDAEFYYDQRHHDTTPGQFLHSDE